MDALLRLIPIVLILSISVWRSSRESRRYGGHTDRTRVHFSPFIRKGTSSSRHPEDHLYDDSGRINRDWKP